MLINEKSPGGRPPKFKGERKPVTVTLPIETLDKLEIINNDRAKAIVKLTDSYFSANVKNNKMVEIIEINPGIGIILVGPNQILKNIDLFKLIEVAPARFLLSIPSGTSIDSIEIALSDLLDEKDSGIPEEYSLVKELLKIMKNLRRDKKVTKAEILFVSI